MEDVKSSLSLAKNRWRFLKQNLLANGGAAGCSTIAESPSSFKGFGFFNFLEEDTDGIVWHTVQLEGNHNERASKYGSFNLSIRFIEPSLDKYLIAGFDNTGNIRVWPCEEVLAYYCFKKRQIFTGKRVCELAGGMTCLAANVIASCSGVADILMSDGNETCIANLQAIVERNRGAFKAQNVYTSCLRWDVEEHWRHLRGAFDSVVAADCLFYEEYHQPLLACLCYVLNDQGVVLIMAPRRGSSLQRFVQSAEKMFLVDVSDDFDAEIMERVAQVAREQHNFHEDSHRPILITLRIRT